MSHGARAEELPPEMPSLRLVMDNHAQIRSFRTAVHCLAKIGSDLHLEAAHDQLHLQTVSSAESAFLSLKLAPTFFSQYVLGTAPLVQTAVLIKHILASLRTQKIAQYEIEIWLHPPQHSLYGAAQMIATIFSENGIRKVYKFDVMDGNVRDAIVDRDAFPTHILWEAKDLFRLLSTFHGNLDEITLFAHPESAASAASGFKACQLQSHAEGSKKTEILHTAVAVDVRTLLHYSHNAHGPTDVTFNIKDFRALATLCEHMGKPVSIKMEQAGAPMLVEAHWEPTEIVNLRATLVLGTIMHSQLDAAMQLPTYNTQQQAAPQVPFNNHQMPAASNHSMHEQYQNHQRHAPMNSQGVSYQQQQHNQQQYHQPPHQQYQQPPSQQYQQQPQQYQQPQQQQQYQHPQQQQQYQQPQQQQQYRQQQQQPYQHPQQQQYQQQVQPPAQPMHAAVEPRPTWRATHAGMPADQGQHQVGHNGQPQPVDDPEQLPGLAAWQADAAAPLRGRQPGSGQQMARPSAAAGPSDAAMGVAHPGSVLGGAAARLQRAPVVAAASGYQQLAGRMSGGGLGVGTPGATPAAGSSHQYNTTTTPYAANHDHTAGPTHPVSFTTEAGAPGMQPQAQHYHHHHHHQQQPTRPPVRAAAPGAGWQQQAAMPTGPVTQPQLAYGGAGPGAASRHAATPPAIATPAAGQGYEVIVDPTIDVMVATQDDDPGPAGSTGAHGAGGYSQGAGRQRSGGHMQGAGGYVQAGGGVGGVATGYPHAGSGGVHGIGSAQAVGTYGAAGVANGGYRQAAAGHGQHDGAAGYAQAGHAHGGMAGVVHDDAGLYKSALMHEAGDDIEMPEAMAGTPDSELINDEQVDIEGSFQVGTADVDM